MPNNIIYCLQTHNYAAEAQDTLGNHTHRIQNSGQPWGRKKKRGGGWSIQEELQFASVVLNSLQKKEQKQIQKILRFLKDCFFFIFCKSVTCSVMSDSFRPHGLQSARLLCPWNSPGKILEWVAFPPPEDLPNSGIKPRSPALRVDSLPSEPPGKPVYIFMIFTNKAFKNM